MSFKLPVYNEPDFTKEPFLSFPDVKTEPVKKAGVAPEGYHALSIYPEYFKINGQWVLAKKSRMDCVAVVREDNEVDVKEFRNLSIGNKVVIGRDESGADGIFVYTDGFKVPGSNNSLFTFRLGRTRETAYSKDYNNMYELLRHDRDHGYIVWVLGPAVVFDYDSRVSLSYLINKGYVHAILAGNAMAVHDLEASVFNTALGQDIYSQKYLPDGHYKHLDLINKARMAGSLEKLIENEQVKDGIVYSAVKRGIPLVLTGSIRDDVPLPGVIANCYASQDEMRIHTSKATTLICLATQLHTIASGNMTPSYTLRDGQIRPVYIYCIDVSEFAVNKLRDRGTLEVTTIVTNVQDFLVHLKGNL